jgi:hypothetical protein
VARPTIAESVTCSATPTTNLTTDVLFGSISGGTDQLYLAFIEIRDASDWGVTSMSGGGLTWTRIHHDQDTQATVLFEVWAAEGSPGSAFQPTIDGFTQQSGPVDTSVAAVAGVCVRIPDADLTTPYQNVGSSDAGATDTSTAAHTGTVGAANSLMIGAIVTRGFTVSSPDADYAAVNNATAGSAGNVANIYVRARTGSSPAVGTDTFSNTLSGAADWICGLIEVLEASAPDVVESGTLTATLTATGDGAVAADGQLDLTVTPTGDFDLVDTSGAITEAGDLAFALATSGDAAVAFTNDPDRF